MPLSLVNARFEFSLFSLQELNKLDLPIQVVAKIRRLIRALEPELKLYRELRESLLTKYAEKDEQGNRIEYDIPGAPAGTKRVSIKPSESLKFNAEMKGLDEQAIALDCDQIAIAEFGDVKIKGIFLDHLDWLISDSVVIGVSKKI